MSERDLSAGLATKIQAVVVYPVLFLEGEFTSGTGRWWSGVGSFSWNGYTWQGLGALLELSEIGETTAIEAKGFSIKLSGQSSANLALALSACRQGARGRVWLGALTAAGTLDDTPYLLREGRLDVPAGTDDGENAVITVTYEDRLIDLERAREWRWTSESQANFYPNDKGFDFVPSLQDAVDVWKPA